MNFVEKVFLKTCLFYLTQPFKRRKVHQNRAARFGMLTRDGTGVKMSESRSIESSNLTVTDYDVKFKVKNFTSGGEEEASLCEVSLALIWG